MRRRKLATILLSMMIALGFAVAATPCVAPRAAFGTQGEPTATAGTPQRATSSTATDPFSMVSGPDPANGWEAIMPVVSLPSRGARVRSGRVRDPRGDRDIEKLISDLASRADFELQIPDPAVAKSRIAQVLWWERDGKVVGVHVLFFRGEGSSAPRFWSAGQMERSSEDPGWRSGYGNMPLATRFWKYRDAARLESLSRSGAAEPSSPAEAGREIGQIQFYRFHRGVESWVGGQLTLAEAISAVESFHEVNQSGVSPIVVIVIGFVLVLAWPAYAAWAAKRKYDAKRELARRRDAVPREGNDSV